MTERIQQIIGVIKNKAVVLHQKLNEEREKNQNLQAEMQSLKEQLDKLINTEKSLVAEISSLKADLEATKAQVVEEPRLKMKNDEEIDELVREIEYCISQLKK